MRELVSQAFGLVGLDWQQYVRVDDALVRRSESVPIVGDSREIARRSGQRAEGIVRIDLEDSARARPEADRLRGAVRAPRDLVAPRRRRGVRLLFSSGSRDPALRRRLSNPRQGPRRGCRAGGRAREVERLAEALTEDLGRDLGVTVDLGAAVEPDELQRSLRRLCAGHREPEAERRVQRTLRFRRRELSVNGVTVSDISGTSTRKVAATAPSALAASITSGHISVGPRSCRRRRPSGWIAARIARLRLRVAADSGIRSRRTYPSERRKTNASRASTTSSSADWPLFA